MVHRGIAVVRRVGATLAVAILAGFSLTSMGVGSASASEADTIASLVNQARASAGLPGLIHNPAMDAVAQQWANQMGAANSMTHNPDYSTQIPSGWSRAGENVATGQPTPSAMHTAWMNSPGHRANILGDFTDIGIAFVTVNGTTWGVEDFGKYAGHAGAPAPAPAPAPAAPAPPAPPAPKAPAPVARAAAAPAPAPVATPGGTAPVAGAAATPTTASTPVPATTPSVASTPQPAASSKATERRVQPSPSGSSESFLLSASDSAIQKPFPIGYVIGGILVVLGIGGGIYGQRMRIRGRKPPDT
ncbi:CAP domain-containing protein [Frigoribacterium sp. UYMn621]|uniref:CAP domain-containing protein n=1 Tax=Frigoribacterium sp. UYMn621 TaxID=3156343 RepID=UPI00339A51E3